MKTVEQIRTSVAAAAVPNSETTRRPIWLTDQRTVGVARDHKARLELFLVAPGLEAKSAAIKNQFSVNLWQQEEGKPFEAARIVLPGADHFVSIIALIAAEILRHGFESNPHAAFLRAEPLIELALLQVGIGEDAALGLLGELYFLEQLLVRAKAGNDRRTLMNGWQGFGRSARDYSSPEIAIEVKATNGAASRHRISNMRQVTPDVSPSGTLSRLYLFSIGFVPTQSSGRSVSRQTQATLDLLIEGITGTDRERTTAIFLDRVAQYGMPVPGNPGGYDHNTMSDWPTYSRERDVAWARLYDMSDEAIQIPRTTDLQSFQHLVENSITFDLVLPVKIRGELNPIANITEVLDDVLASMLQNP